LQTDSHIPDNRHMGKKITAHHVGSAVGILGFICRRHFIRPMMISLQCSNAVLHQPPCRENPQPLNYCRFSRGCKGRNIWKLCKDRLLLTEVTSLHKKTETRNTQQLLLHRCSKNKPIYRLRPLPFQNKVPRKPQRQDWPRH